MKIKYHEQDGTVTEKEITVYQSAESSERELLERMTAQIAQSWGVTEELKAADEMEWVRQMNNARACAREIMRG